MGKIFTLLTSLFLLHFNLWAAAPTTSSSNLNVYGNDGNQFYIGFTNGNGNSRIIILKAGSPIDFTDLSNLPDNKVNYSASSVFGTAGTEFKTTGGYVVHNGSAGNGTLVSGLSLNTTYYIAIFEYNGTGAAIEYRLVPGIGSGSTVNYPTQQTSNISFSQVAGNKMLVSWTGGNGAGTLVIARKGADPAAVPADFTSYSSSGSFGNAFSAIAPGEFVVSNNTANSFWFDKLEPNTTYHLAFYEYNGNSKPIFLIPATIVTKTTNAGPTTGPGNTGFYSIGGDRLSLAINQSSSSNASKYLIIARQGAAPTFTPTNGNTVYSGVNAFGSGTEVAPGEYVVSASNSTNINVTNLLPGTVYYFAVYGYDSDNSGNNYYLTTAGSFGLNSVTTASTPSNQASITGASVASGTSMKIDFTKAAGSTNTLIVMKAGSPVDADPVDYTTYTYSPSFKFGSQLGTGNYVVFDGTGNSATVSNLTAGVTYYFAIYAFNGPISPVYKRPGATGSFTMPNEPTAPATGMTFPDRQGNSIQVAWTNGTGANRIVIARKNSPVTATPADFITYTANSAFGSGQQIASGEYVVYNSNGTSVYVTNLEAGTTYYFAVFEYNGSGAASDYRISSYLSGNNSTYGAPTTQVSGISASSIQTDRATISYTVGNGTGRMFVMKAGSPVANNPVDFAIYSPSGSFGSGTSLGSGEYVVQKAGGNSAFIVASLTAGTTYHIAAYEYNGNSGHVFLIPAATYTFTTAGGIAAPTTASSGPNFSTIEGTSFQFNWTSGNGSNRIVVAKQGSAPQWTPVNGTTYSANSSFGSGQQVAPDEYIVFNNSGSSVSVSALVPNTTYYFAVYEYNGTGVSTKYLTSASLAASHSSATRPTTGSTTASATFPTSTSMQLSWTNGTGANRLVVLKQGSAVTGIPGDLTDYNANATFGNGGQLNAGEYIVHKLSTNTVTISGLTSGATYYYKIFDFNGSTAPVYNTANALSGSVVVTPLPLTWLSFTGRKTDNGFQLNWSTADEINTSHFNVERSEDGVAYSVIATIAAKGAGSTNQYDYLDLNANNKYYYRIKQVDIDGKSEYSKVVISQGPHRQDKVLLYPNPAVKQVYIQVGGKATVRIYDTNGHQVQVSQLVKPAYLDVQTLKPGVYIVEVVEQDMVYRSRLIKQ